MWIYHATVEWGGETWRAVGRTLRDHGAVIGDETREEALTLTENVSFIILSEFMANGPIPPPDTTVPGGIPLTIETG